MMAELREAPPDDECLKSVVCWLRRAQDIHPDAGIASVYHAGSGWGEDYPETTGYIIPTFIKYSEIAGDEDFLCRAIAAGDWEISIQTGGGGVLSSPSSPECRVFNTGQVILGWCALFEKTSADRFMQAAQRAGDYLDSLQEADGAWRQDTYCGARTYHARVDWALLKLAKLSGKERYIKTALNNINWVLRQQQPNGWFDNVQLQNWPAITHVIAYTLRGLLESEAEQFAETAELKLIQRIIPAAEAICHAAKNNFVKIPGLLPTSFDCDWQSKDRDSCITGDCQMAINLYRLAQLTGREDFAACADIIVNAVKQTVIYTNARPELVGAVAGSYPVYHGYVPFGFPNWAAKFFADALMLKSRWENGFYVKS